MNNEKAMKNPIETKPEVGSTIVGWAVIRQHPERGTEVKLHSVRRCSELYSTLEAATQAAHEMNDRAMRGGFVPVAVTLTITDVPAYQHTAPVEIDVTDPGDEGGEN